MTLNIHDELTLQALVDGELTVAERNACLGEISGDDVESWRTVALAFVEDQAMRHGMREHAGAKPAPQTNVPARTAAITQVATSGAVVERVQERSRMKRGSWQVVAAALGVLAIALGGFAWGHANGREAGLLAGKKSRIESPIAQANNDTADALPSLPAVVDPWLTQPWAAQMRAQLLQAGYLVDPRPVPVKVTLPGGRTTQVILSDPDIQYVGNAAFQ